MSDIVEHVALRLYANDGMLLAIYSDPAESWKRDRQFVRVRYLAEARVVIEAMEEMGWRPAEATWNPYPPGDIITVLPETVGTGAEVYINGLGQIAHIKITEHGSIVGADPYTSAPADPRPANPPKS